MDVWEHMSSENGVRLLGAMSWRRARSVDGVPAVPQPNLQTGIAVEWHGRQPWSWAVELGDWLAAAGDSASALEAYRQALEWKPGDENIQKKIQEMLGTDSTG